MCRDVAGYYNTPGVTLRNGALKIACLFSNPVPNYIFYCLVLKISVGISRALTATVREEARPPKLQLEPRSSSLVSSRRSAQAVHAPTPHMNIHCGGNSCECYCDSPAKLCHRRCQNGYGRNDQAAANSIKRQTVKGGGAPSKG